MLLQLLASSVGLLRSLRPEARERGFGCCEYAVAFAARAFCALHFVCQMAWAHQDNGIDLAWLKVSAPPSKRTRRMQMQYMKIYGLFCRGDMLFGGRTPT